MFVLRLVQNMIKMLKDIFSHCLHVVLDISVLLEVFIYLEVTL